MLIFYYALSALELMAFHDTFVWNYNIALQFLPTLISRIGIFYAIEWEIFSLFPYAKITNSTTIWLWHWKNFSSFFDNNLSFHSVGSFFPEYEFFRFSLSETPFDLLVEYVEKGFYGQASRLSYAWKLFNKYENKDVLGELKYKDGNPALDKLNELRTKCRNTILLS